MPQYRPRSAPKVTTLEDLQQWVANELDAIAQAQGESIALELRQVGHAPAKPRAGMIVSADGVGWNPGSGAGAYEYKGGAWVKL